jgi:hypothetical protein
MKSAKTPAFRRTAVGTWSPDHYASPTERIVKTRTTLFGNSFFETDAADDVKRGSTSAVPDGRAATALPGFASTTLSSVAERRARFVASQQTKTATWQNNRKLQCA